MAGQGNLNLDTATHWQQLVHRLPLLFFAAAAVAGIVVDAWLGPTMESAIGASRVLAVWLPCLMVVALVVLASKSTTRWLAFFVAAIPLAAARHALCDASFADASISSLTSDDAQPTILEVTIDRPIVLRRHPLADSPSHRDQSPWQTQFESRVDRVRVGQSYRPFTGRVLVVSDGRLDQYYPGDQLRVFGSMRRFAAPTNPGERDLRSVYRRRGLHARVDADGPRQIISLDTAPRVGVYRTIAWMARRSRELLLQHTGETTGPLALALVIGQREFVDDQTRDSLLVTGTAHLLSVSGLHLAIVVLLANWLATLLQAPKRVKIVWVLAVCVLYTAITGGRPPVVRAAILVSALMVSIWIKRPGQAINTLSLAGIILIFFNPENVFSVGMQLSFLAVATLVLCGRRSKSNTPAVEQALQREERLQNLMEGSLSKPLRYARWAGFYVVQMIWFSGCVTCISIPLVWHQFHVVSFVSVLTNVVLSLFLLVTLAAGVATVVVGGLIAEPLAAIPGWICHWLLLAMQRVIDWAAAIPGGHFWLPAPPTWCVVLFYLVIAGSLRWNNDARVSITRRLWVPLWIAAAWLIATTASDMGESAVEATFVDVSHGTCVVLRLGEDDVWLYDCGRLGNDRGSSRDIDATLWSLGITHLDGIFLSHADADHYNGLPGVLRRFRVDQIITPPGMLATAEPGLADARQAIASHAIPVREVWAGQSIDVANHRLSILHPPTGGVVGSDNANSLVLSIQHDAVALILPGDLEPPGTAELINQDRPPPGGILMAPHHGSLTMDARAVLQWARPRETIVSGGRRARRPAVRKMLAVTGSGVHVTAEVGAIRVRIGTDHQIDVRSWTESPW